MNLDVGSFLVWAVPGQLRRVSGLAPTTETRDRRREDTPGQWK